MELKHQRELEIVREQLKEAKKLAESREAELLKEIDSLKRIIAELQDKLGMLGVGTHRYTSTHSHTHTHTHTCIHSL